MHHAGQCDWSRAISDYGNAIRLRPDCPEPYATTAEVNTTPQSSLWHVILINQNGSEVEAPALETAEHIGQNATDR